MFQVKLWDLQFRSPIGISAGIDNEGNMQNGFHDIGFGFTEVGAVSFENNFSVNENFRLLKEK